MVSDKLQRAPLIETFKKLKDDRVANVRFDLPHVDHPLVFDRSGVAHQSLCMVVARSDALASARCLRQKIY